MTTNSVPGHVRVIAAVVDTRQVVFYKEDGSTISLFQGDPRLKTLLDQAVAQINEKGYADLDFDQAPSNAYGSFEKQSKGMVRFFRVAKEKLKSWLSDDAEPTAPIPEQAIGTVPTEQPKLSNVIDEIVAHAIPANHASFNEKGLDTQAPIIEESSGMTPNALPERTSPDTIVAVVETKNGTVMVPGVERVRNQIARAERLGSPNGVANFIRRAGEVAQQRKHSVEDLLNFMERGDLPITEDGSILIYKVLNKTADGKAFTDCHTSKVRQWVGAKVCMDPSLVDHNRNNECSNGLHVARRGYIHGFHGNACVLAKLAPEDVIAVPSYDANKMRVCAYHIIAELTDRQHALVRANKPISEDPGGKQLLAQALVKDYPITDEVRITGHKGEGVQVTKLNAPSTQGTKEKLQDKPVIQIEQVDTLDAEAKAETIDPKDVASQVVKTEKTRQQRIADLVSLVQDRGATEEVRAQSLEQLRDIKKIARRPYEQLGVPASVVQLLTQTAPVQAQAQPAVQAKAPKVQKAKSKSAAKPKTKLKVKATPKAQSGTKEKPVPVSVSDKPRDKVAALLKQLGNSTSRNEHATALAKEIAQIKRFSKKGWNALGVSEEQQKLIQLHLS